MRGSIILLLSLVLVLGFSPARIPSVRREPAPIPQVSGRPQRSAGSGQGAFLILTDIHFDPFADPALVHRLAAAPVEQWASIFQSSGNQAISRGAVDTGYPLFVSALNAARQAAQNSSVPLDYVVNNGDFLAHNFAQKYIAAGLEKSGLEQFTINTMVFVSREIQNAFPGKPVISAFGNNDSTCGDYFAPGDKLLGAMAGEWRTVALNRGAAGDFAAGGYYALPDPALPRHELIVLNTSFWSSNHHPGCRSSSADPGVVEQAWLREKLEQMRQQRRTVTLIMHIPPGVDAFASARQGSCDKSTALWNKQYLDFFLDTVRVYKDLLRDGLAGHIHHDDFRVLYDSAGAPALEIHIAPALSPVYSNNPAFEIAVFDKPTGALANYSVEYLRNYFSAASGSTSADWQAEYDFGHAYAPLRVGPLPLDSLARQIRMDPAVRAKYEDLYGVMTPRPPDITENNWRYFSCAQTESSSAEYGRCACPAPAGR